jgi:hypothetical protein
MLGRVLINVSEPDVRFQGDCVAKLDGFVDEGRPRILVSPLTRLSREGSCGLDALTATPDATLTLRKRLMVEHGQGA